MFTSRLARFVRDKALLAGLPLAFAGFALTFRGPRKDFWQRMTRTALSLGALAFVAQPRLREIKPTPKDVAAGLASAGALYLIFQAGDRLARAILPGGAADIASIYELRTLRPKAEIAARLALVVGPAEELFWRGLVQERLTRKYGSVRGMLLATGAYGGAHLVAGNLTLIGAATVAGGFWSAMAANGMSMSGLIVSHIAWDVWIFLVAPTATAGSLAVLPIER